MNRQSDIAAERIGEHLKQVIDKSPYSQAMVAGELGVDPKTLWRYLNGDSRAPDEIIQDIARTCKDDSVITKCAMENELCYAMLLTPDYSNINRSYTNILDTTAELPRAMPALFNSAGIAEKTQTIEELALTAIKSWWEILAHIKQGGTQ